ncbi:MAG: ABC transporter permease [Lachnospiraceae bacterium]|nr:ABC transporter permease [Lachnospiraceae bacterium]
MTSGNSLSINMHRLQKDLLARRLWVIIFVTLPLLLIYPFLCGLQLASLRPQFAQGSQLVSVITGTAVFYVTNELFVVMIFTIAAVFLAIQGFSYLFHRDRTDFYESLPFPRKRRFLLVYTNGLLIFFCAYAVAMLLTLVVGIAYGARPSVLLPVIAFSMLRFFLFFAAVYAVCTVGVMLAGSVLYAIILAGFLFLAPVVYEAAALVYADVHFKTWAGGFTLKLLLNPFYRLLKKTGITGYPAGSYYQSLSEKTDWSSVIFREQAAGALPHMLLLLLCFVVATFAAYVLYEKRKAEWAGTTICHKPVHVFVKIVTAAGSAIVIAIGIQGMFFYEEASDAASTVRMLVMLVCIAVLVSFFLEGMYRRSVREAFSDKHHLIPACVLALAFFFAFRLDVFGYDRFMPDKAGVTDYAVVLDSGGMMPYWFVTEDENEVLMTRDEYIRGHMVLTDVEAIARLTEQSNALLANGGYPEGTCVAGRVYFRKANGNVTARRIMIPVNTDDSLLARVFETEEYVQCVSQVYHDALIREHLSAMANLSFSTDAEYCEKKAKSSFGEGTLYDAFAEAYRKDLARYSVRQEREEAAVGIVTLYNMRPVSEVVQVNLDTTSTAMMEDFVFPVYSGYKNTLAFLKEADLYHEELAPYEGAAGASEGDTQLVAQVWKYGTVSYDMPSGMMATEEQEVSMLFEGDEAEEIIANSVCTRFLSDWYDRDGLLDLRYGIDITSRAALDATGYTDHAVYDHAIPVPAGYDLPAGRSFFKGQVPAFVTE